MRLICSLFLMVLCLVPAAFADEGGVVTDAPAIASAQGQLATVINVAPDAPQVVKLDQEAASVIVGSPTYASVVLDNPTTLLIMPRAQGSTSLTVLNKKGEIIMERRLIVGAPADNYVRIRRACTSKMPGCEPSELFYCPDGCHSVGLAPGSRSAPPAESSNDVPVQNMNFPPEIPAIDPAELESKPQ